MNKLDLDYQALLADILENGRIKGDRTGTGTISVFGRTIRHKMSDGFPLLTTKKMYTKGIIIELLWFLQGGTNIKYLVDNDCNIWNGDAYKKYYEATKGNDSINNEWMLDNVDGSLSMYTMAQFIEKIKTDKIFSDKWGELGPTYGKQWRKWENAVILEDGSGEGWYEEPIDQIMDLINDIKTNPDSRRLMVNAWNVAEVDQMTLPPCHYGFQCYTRELTDSERFDWYYKRSENKMGLNHDHIVQEMDEKNVPTRELSLIWNQRSVDTFLGLPFNIASYGLLLCILANEVNMVPGELIGNLGDTHLYLNHIEPAKEQIGRELNLEERENIAYVKYPSLNEEPQDALVTHSDFTHEWADSLNIPKRTREPFKLPTLNIKLKPSVNSYADFKPETWSINDFEIIGYKSHGKIEAKLSN